MAENADFGQGTRRLDPQTVQHILPEEAHIEDHYPAPWVIEVRVVGTPHVTQIQVRGEIVIGRATKDRQGVVPHINLEPFNAYQRGVSRRHAIIFSHENQLMIRDLESANGTYLNENALIALKDYRLRHGDTVTVGKLQLQVFYAVMPSANNIAEKTQPVKFEIPSLGKGQHLLVADNDRDVAYVLGTILEQAGFTITLVSTFAEAVSLMENHKPAALISELMLPDRSGLDLVRYVRQRNPNMPLLIVTSVTAGYQMSQALDAGVDVFMCKPVGVDELLRGVGKVADRMR